MYHLDAIEFVFCLFDSLPPWQTTIFQLCCGRISVIEPGSKQKLMCLAPANNAVTQVRLKPATPPSRDKHSITEPLHSPI